MDMIYLNEKKVSSSELPVTENDSVIRAGGKIFAVRKQFNDSIAVRWLKDGIEFEVSGPENWKDEIIKMVQSISGVSVTID
jgi:hypothetical protein